MVERPAASAGLVLEEGLSERIAAAFRGDRQPLPRLGAVLVGLWESRDGDRLSYALPTNGWAVSRGPSTALRRRRGTPWMRASASCKRPCCCRWPVSRAQTVRPGTGRHPRRPGRRTGAGGRSHSHHLHDHGLVQRSHGPLGPRARLVSQALVDGYPPGSRAGSRTPGRQRSCRSAAQPTSTPILSGGLTDRRSSGHGDGGGRSRKRMGWPRAVPGRAAGCDLGSHP